MFSSYKSYEKFLCDFRFDENLNNSLSPGYFPAWWCVVMTSHRQTDNTQIWRLAVVLVAEILAFNRVHDDFNTWERYFKDAKGSIDTSQRRVFLENVIFFEITIFLHILVGRFQATVLIEVFHRYGIRVV